MVAEMVGGALLSGFLNVMFDRLATKEVVGFFQAKKAIADLVDELKILLLSANVLLNDAEEKQFRDQSVKNWLGELKEVLYKADHVIDKINTEALRCQVEDGESESTKGKIVKFMTKLYSAFDNTVKSEMQEILRTLKLLVDQKDCLGLKEGVSSKPLQMRPFAPLVEESDVFGRNGDKDSLIETLLSEDNGEHSISVIPVVGMGGIGKTTLAQLVYNDSKVQEHFEPTAWVTVGEEFDVLKLTKAICKGVACLECGIEDLYQLQAALKGTLMGKKFLIVLDDVWNEDYNLWDLLKSPFEIGANGSKVIVTTRSGIVARKMGTASSCTLQTLSDDDCWKVFAKHVRFHDLFSVVHSDLQEIGFEIVKKCKGLPLAVKSMAGLLRSVSDPEEWRRIVQSDVWELQFEENQKHKIPPALWLSYRFLPQQLKRCFAYCSIFPKDYEFLEDEKEQLILLWMAEGLLHKKGKRMEAVGKEYLDDLISRSFFQQSRRYGESILHMHDLVHDLAIRTSGEFSFIDDVSKFSHDCGSKIYHLSYWRSEGMMNLEGLSQTKSLRTFLSFPLSLRWGCHWQTIQPELLLSASLAEGCLRVLSLFDSRISELPDSINNLKHLRYLDLSATKLKKLPSSICSLYNLQTLLLARCNQLTQLPTNMCSLISLRHLVINDTPLTEMPPHMSNLTNLQTLSDFVLGKNSGSRIKELGALRLLSGSLCIKGLENAVDVGDVLEAGLKKKEFLTELILMWNHGETDDTSKEREVLNGLEPHKKLKKLEIQGYRGTIFPDWIAHGSFDHMVEVRLTLCENCCLLPSFEQLPSLKVLDIGGMPNACFGVSLTKPFPFLEELVMEEIALERWPTGANEEGGLFPCLKHIKLRSCDKLKVGLPAGCLPSLERVDIWSCKEMVVVFPTSQDIDTAYPSLESIGLNGCEKVESFSEMGLPSNLKQLDIDGCEKLIANRMRWNLQRLSKLQSLYLCGSKQLGVEDSFPEEGLLPSSLTFLNIGYFENLKSLNGNGLRHLTSLQTLYINGCEKLERLPEDGLPSSLCRLIIYGCPLLKVQCQRETGEDWPKIQHIPTVKIDGEHI